MSVSGVDVTVSPDTETANTGDLITVNVSLEFQEVSWIPSPWFLDGVTLSASSIMRKEGFE